MGVDFETASEHISEAQTVMRFVANYETPPFPGEIDFALASQGQGLYAAHCASCHGTYRGTLKSPSLASFPNHVSDVGTDSVRLSLLTEEFADAVNASSMGRHVHVPGGDWI